VRQARAERREVDGDEIAMSENLASRRTISGPDSQDRSENPAACERGRDRSRLQAPNLPAERQILA
jgi:hypothetical protein